MNPLRAIGRGLRTATLALCMLGSVESVASAETRFDWSRGLVIASVGAPADLRAPNPELARVKAERIASKRCRKALLGLAASLPLASGKTVGSKLGSALESAPLAFVSIDSDQGSDGSVVVTMALAVDSLRAELYGADEPVPVELQAPPVFVDARKLSMAPSVGIVIRSDGVEYRGPTLFFHDEDVARKDAGLAKDAILHKAKTMKRGVIEIEGESLAKRFAGKPLVVVLTKEKR